MDEKRTILLWALLPFKLQRTQDFWSAPLLILWWICCGVFSLDIFKSHLDMVTGNVLQVALPKPGALDLTSSRSPFPPQAVRDSVTRGHLCFLLLLVVWVIVQACLTAFQRARKKLDSLATFCFCTRALAVRADQGLRVVYCKSIAMLKPEHQLSLSQTFDIKCIAPTKWWPHICCTADVGRRMARRERHAREDWEHHGTQEIAEKKKRKTVLNYLLFLQSVAASQMPLFHPLTLCTKHP